VSLIQLFHGIFFKALGSHFSIKAMETDGPVVREFTPQSLFVYKDGNRSLPTFLWLPENQIKRHDRQIERAPLCKALKVSGQIISQPATSQFTVVLHEGCPFSCFSKCKGHSVILGSHDLYANLSPWLASFTSVFHQALCFSIIGQSGPFPSTCPSNRWC